MEQRTYGMAITTIFLLASSTAALKAEWDLPVLPLQEPGKGLTVARLQIDSDPGPLTPLEITNHVIPLTRRNARSRSSGYAQTIREQAMAAQANSRLSVRLLILLCVVLPPH